VSGKRREGKRSVLQRQKNTEEGEVCLKIGVREEVRRRRRKVKALPRTTRLWRRGGGKSD